MKKILLGLGVVVAFASCTTNQPTGTVGTITKVAQITSAISEISSLLGGLNLTNSQTSIVKSALTNYISNYNKVDTTKSGYQSVLEGYKTKALTDIKTGIGESKYGEFLSTLKTATNKAQNTTVSDVTLGVIASLVK
ncbi:hypothetical protein [Faecalibacter rhinopitheci]|uniref:Lipoprotein n=1 Tax=Faecalibacter rhinopitheci TaxID=2779678 RepID=A0A8J7FWN7_9FLAO|nr:hypothetical protein [Faecalibacter rhinopitheci]MBF0598016.1 hypothetical protein [Faecalibacter rhinopitheci]